MNFKRITFCVVCLLGVAGLDSSIFAQAGLRKSLERLDENDNGKIEPKEVTSLARPYLERITETRGRRDRSRLDRPIEIDSLLESARIYHALKNGVAGMYVRPSGESSVKEFGPDRNEPVVPEFGLAEIKFPYTAGDLAEADYRLRYNDYDKDGFIDRQEARWTDWTHRDPFADDLNKDDRLSRMELAQRYARRRLLSGASRELVRKARRTGGEIRNRNKQEKEGNQPRSSEEKDAHKLTASMMKRFDANENGRLDKTESSGLGLPVGQIDFDNDGELVRDELFALVKRLQDEAGNSAEGLPGWFYELDKDRDGQVAMDEFAADWTQAKYDEFDAFDLNRDGLLTDVEILQSKSIVGGSFRNDEAQVLPPRRTIISEIEIAEDFLIRDLNVQISITHSDDSMLDGFLTGPNGERIELFAEVGSGGANFDGTTFDNQADEAIASGQPPFAGKYKPKGAEDDKPGLNTYNGKSIKGVWQLVIRGTRSDRIGMLHSWGLSVTPVEDSSLKSHSDASQKGRDGGKDKNGEKDETDTDGEKDEDKPAFGLKRLLNLIKSGTN